MGLDYIFHFIVSILCFSTFVVAREIQSCSPYNCRLPDCFCSGSKIPGNVDKWVTPQIIMMSFQGAVTERSIREYAALFRGRQNPNKCPYSSTIFVQHEYTKYPLVQQLFRESQEIALFGGYSSQHEPKSLGDWLDQIEALKKNLNQQAGIPMQSLNGYRLFGGWAPGGDLQYNALQMTKLSYDSSLKCTNMEFWPYTFDYRTTQGCPVPVCPTQRHPGFWEAPITYFYDTKGVPCAEMDSCRGVHNEIDAFNLLMENFYRHYYSNRAPFPMFFHDTWLQKYNYTLPAVLKFMDVISRMQDVYVVSMNKTIEWVKKPTPLSSITKFQPWSC